MSLVLSLDTATTIQAVALVRDDEALLHWQRRERQNHGVTLLKTIDEALRDQRLSLDQLTLIAVGLGPGSFTGLRVGLAVAKGLSRVCGAPILGVSTLAAWAHSAQRGHEPVWAALDARRGEVYAGCYLRQADGQVHALVPDQAYSPQALIDALNRSQAEHGPGLTLAGYRLDAYPELTEQGALGALLERGMQRWLPPYELPGALGVAALGAARWRAQAGRGDALASLEPNYIRPSDAELSWARRQP